MKDKAREHPCLNATEEETDTLVLTTVIGGQRSHTAHRFDHIIFFKFLSSVPEDVAFGLGCQKSRCEPTPTLLPTPSFNHPRGLQRNLIRCGHSGSRKAMWKRQSRQISRYRNLRALAAPLHIAGPNCSLCPSHGLASCLALFWRGNLFLSRSPPAMCSAALVGLGSPVVVVDALHHPDRKAHAKAVLWQKMIGFLGFSSSSRASC